MEHISILKNPVQKYAWGSGTFLQSLLNWPEPWKEPAAELWMGAHPKSPSEVAVDGEWRSLIDVIEADPVSVLGAGIAEKFSNRLPFLFKVLAADHPLSIQVHPDMAQAREGFNRENRRGVPVGAPERNYRDAGHKPECLCAVTAFEGHEGLSRAERDSEIDGSGFPKGTPPGIGPVTIKWKFRRVETLFHIPSDHGCRPKSPGGE